MGGNGGGGMHLVHFQEETLRILSWKSQESHSDLAPFLCPVNINFSVPRAGAGALLLSLLGAWLPGSCSETLSELEVWSLVSAKGRSGGWGVQQSVG